jgi:tetratricopeptide (TPR) repeat protein
MRSQIDPEARLEELEAGALDAIRRLSDLDDPGALAEAEVVRGWAYWIRCRAGETEQAVLRALDLSLGTGAGGAVRQSFNLYLGAALFGPLPVADGIRRCEAVLASPPDRATEATAMRALAGLRAMEGSFEAGRALLRQDREIVDELGLRVAAATAAEVWAMIELLDGEPGAAEEKLREADELLRELGETSTRANVSALLAETLFRQARRDEALTLVAEARELSSAQDVCAQVYWRGPAAKALAEEGRLADAEQVAREAVALAEPTDFSTMRANAFLDLAFVLQLGGRDDEAEAASREALMLLDAKGNVATAAYARRVFV